MSGPAVKAPTPFHRMEAALCEAGRHDIAAHLQRNRINHPKVGPLIARFPDDVDLIARAAHIAYTGVESYGFTTWQGLARFLKGKPHPGGTP